MALATVAGADRRPHRRHRVDQLPHREALTVAEVWRRPRVRRLGGYGWEWINAAFLAGGAALLALRIAAWRVPAALLGTLVLLALIRLRRRRQRQPRVAVVPLFSGGTMLAAFFFATDPVTHPASARGQICSAA
jgi:Na+-translocating ferredoxin:NAD+ oxidoreductase subunit D